MTINPRTLNPRTRNPARNPNRMKIPLASAGAASEASAALGPGEAAASVPQAEGSPLKVQGFWWGFRVGVWSELFGFWRFGLSNLVVLSPWFLVGNGEWVIGTAKRGTERDYHRVPFPHLLEFKGAFEGPQGLLSGPLKA